MTRQIYAKVRDFVENDTPDVTLDFNGYLPSTLNVFVTSLLAPVTIVIEGSIDGANWREIDAFALAGPPPVEQLQPVMDNAYQHVRVRATDALDVPTVLGAGETLTIEIAG